MNGAWPAVSTVAAALASLLGIWMVQRNAKRANATDLTQRIIDQLQETYGADREEWHKERAALHERQTRTERRLENAEAVSRLLADHVSQLRHHIDMGNPPPPPPYPAGWPQTT